MSWFRELVERLFGAWGVQALDFYLANSLWINAIVLLYGLVLAIAWLNLQTIRRKLVSDLVIQIRNHPEIGADSNVNAVLRATTIPWEHAVGEARFPLVAEQWAFGLRRTSVEAVQPLLPDKDLAHDALKLLAASQARRPRREVPRE